MRPGQVEPGRLRKYMSTSARVSDRIDMQHYEDMLRISEAISACREPQELATVMGSLGLMIGDQSGWKRGMNTDEKSNAA